MTIVDARDRELDAGPYRRIVSLVPSLTDTVCGLGAADRLVGRTLYCTEPRLQVRGVPEYGGTKNPKVERILDARPDLVLACVEENKEEHLAAFEDAGVPVYTVMPRSLDDIDDLLAACGELLDVADAARKARDELAAAREEASAWRERLSTRQQEADGAFPVPAVTLIWKNPWLAAGAGTHINAVMEAVGLANLFADRRDYFAIEIEDLAQHEPELVLMPDEPYRWSKRDLIVVAEAAGRAETPEFCPRLDGKLLTWYGTRTAPSLRELIHQLEDLLITVG
jgi:ABC-type hemin transport system substrate-binding protein